MRESVCLVLNEREPLKARSAEALQRSLEHLNITASRLSITEDVAEIIREKRPKVLVLDYLLGDYSTGLDVLTSLQELEIKHRPKVYFLTDEPSVPVAVEAMRLGAINYFELDNPQSVSRLTREISSLLESMRATEHIYIPEFQWLALGELIAQTPASKRCLDQATAAALHDSPLTIISGPPGSGRTTMAHALRLALQDQPALSSQPLITRHIDISLYTQAIQTILELEQGMNLILILENIDNDTGELLEAISSSRHSNVYLIGTTANSDIVRAWKRIIPSTALVEIPPLSERTRDIPALVQRFVVEASELSGGKVKNLDSPLVQWIASLEWPGQLRQLRATLINAVLLATSKREGEFREVLQEQREIWEQSESSPVYSLELNPHLAASTLEFCGHNYRIAAARLGCTAQSLLKLVKDSELAHPQR